MKKLTLLLCLLVLLPTLAAAHPLWPLEVGRLWGWDDGTLSEIASEAPLGDGFTQYSESNALGAGIWVNWKTDAAGNVFITGAGDGTYSASLSPHPVWLPASAAPGVNWANQSFSATITGGVISPIQYSGTLSGAHEGVRKADTPWGAVELARIHITVNLTSAIAPDFSASVIIEYAAGIGPLFRSFDNGVTWDSVIVLGSKFTPTDPGSLGQLKAQFSE